MSTFLATFLTSRWILLVSSLIEYRLTFLTTQCYPELQRKTDLVCFPCLTYISFWIGLRLLHVFGVANPCDLITTLKVFSASLDLSRWGHSYHTLTTPFVDYPSPATPELLLQTSYSSCSGSHFNIQGFMDSNKTLSGSNLGCATLIPHSILTINVYPSRRVKLRILLATWLPIPWIILTNSHGRLIMYSYMHYNILALRQRLNFGR